MAILGCIADDFTGAGDAASFLVRGGMSVQLYNGVPESQQEEPNSDVQALVVALKSRTAAADRAVADSLAAAEFMRRQGVQQIYFKYCSTFDSTPQGNIGPVADALMEFTDAPYTLLLPSLPVNGRKVLHGILTVNGVPLHESHMRNHPLTPMRESSLSRLMEPQSRYHCRVMSRDEMAQFHVPQREEDPFYIIPDYETDADGREIAAKFWKLPLLTGGSGILEHLARMWTQSTSGAGKVPDSGTEGRALLLAGSCSKATLDQIAWYQKAGKPCYRLSPQEMMAGHQSVMDAWNYIQSHTTDEDTVLVYSSDTPEGVQEAQKLGAERVAAMLESATAELARRAVREGYTRIISAGGETSGAVTKGLDYSSYLMGESVAPGVPVMVPAEKPEIRLVLKSGNFGQEDFFCRALEITKK